MTSHDSTTDVQQHNGDAHAWGRNANSASSVGGASWRGAVGASSAGVRGGWPSSSSNKVDGTQMPHSTAVAADVDGSADIGRAWFDEPTPSLPQQQQQHAASGHQQAWRSQRVLDKMKGGEAVGATTSQVDASSASAPSSSSSSLAASARPPSSSPAAPADASSPEFGNTAGDVQWFYLDPQRMTQGPFSSFDMQMWYKSGFFDLQLPVQCVASGVDGQAVLSHDRFIPLGNWFQRGNPAFLPSLPPQFVKQQEATTVPLTDSAHVSSGLEVSSPAGASRAVAVNNNGPLSPVDESSSYAARVHQLVADDDDLSAQDRLELERYNSTQQQQQQQSTGAQPSSVTSATSSPGLNAAAQPWSTARTQQQPQQQQQPAWASNARNAGSLPTNSPSQPQSQQLYMSQQQQQALHHQMQQQQQVLLRLLFQYQQLTQLSLDQFLSSLQLTKESLSQFEQSQLHELDNQWRALNQQRALSQSQLRPQIQQLQMQIAAMAQQQQQQQQQPQLHLQPQQQGGYQQFQQKPQQFQQQQHFGGGGGFDAFGRPVQQQSQLQQQQGVGAFNSQQRGEFQQQQQFPPQQQRGFGQQGQHPNAFGNFSNFPQQPQQQQQQQPLQGQHAQLQRNGIEQPLRDQFGNLSLQQQQQQPQQQLHQQPYGQFPHSQPQPHSQALLQQAPSQPLAPSSAQLQQPSDIGQAVVYTPNSNQVQTAEPVQTTQQQQQPQSPPVLQKPQSLTTAAAVPQSYAEAAAAEHTAEAITGDESTEADVAAEAEEDATAEEEQDAGVTSEEAQAPATTSAAAPSATSAAGPSVAPWAASARAGSGAGEASKVKSLLEIQQEEERAQQLKQQQQKGSAAGNRRALPFSQAAWGNQATGLTLTPDDAVSSGSALLPTPPSTTPSIRLLTPVLSTQIKPNARATGAVGKSGRRTEAAIAQMDAEPAQATSPASAPVNAWGAQQSAGTPVATKSDAAPAPVVNAWSLKRTPAGVSAPLSVAASSSSAPLLPSPSPSSGAATSGAGASSVVSVLNPPLLTIRPKSMQLEGVSVGASGVPVTKPLNTVRILETQILEPQAAQLQQQQQQGRKGAQRERGERGSGARSQQQQPQRKSSAAASSSSASSDALGSSSGVSSPAGPAAMSAELERWCAAHMSCLGAAGGEQQDHAALTSFLMTLGSDQEVREMLVANYGATPGVEEFADGFLQLRAFEGSVPIEGRHKDAAKAAAEADSGKDEQRKKRGGGRKKN